MKTITLGSTGITTIQNGFGALPIQRVDKETAVEILHRAYEGGMRFFDTARAYSDSEEKLGLAFKDIDRKSIYIATKSMAKTPEEFKTQLEESLRLLQTDYIDIYQFHCAKQVYKPNDGTGMYEAMLEAKQQGKIKHIGITAHLIAVAEETVESGLYETLQYPFSYLSTDREIALVKRCKEKNMGFIGMKGLAGGLLTNSKACMAFASQFDNFIPIWGVQRMNELEEWLSYNEHTPEYQGDIKAFVEEDKHSLQGEFCRGCGYCMPCPVGITINQCARISQMVRRAPSANWLNEHWQNEMAKIPNCLHCNQCASKCPYQLDTPRLLEKNYEDYQNILSGKTKI